MTIRLSKSNFVAGCQCLKRLYLQVHEPELAAEPDVAAEAIIEQGRQVGLLTRQMFPGGVAVESRDREQAIRATRELIENPQVPAIFEAAFEYHNYSDSVAFPRKGISSSSSRTSALWRFVFVLAKTLFSCERTVL